VDVPINTSLDVRGGVSADKGINSPTGAISLFSGYILRATGSGFVFQDTDSNTILTLGEDLTATFADQIISSASGITIPGLGAFGSLTTTNMDASGNATVGGTLGVTGVIKSTTIQASGGAGIYLVDDSLTKGIFVEDGGYVGFGDDAADPNAPIHISTSSQNAFLRIRRNSTTKTDAPKILFQKNASNSFGFGQTSAGELLAEILSSGVDTAISQGSGGAIRFYQNGASGSQRVPTEMWLMTSPGGTTDVQNRVKISETGVADFIVSGATIATINATGVGIGTTSPNDRFHVEGTSAYYARFERTSAGAFDLGNFATVTGDSYDFALLPAQASSGFLLQTKNAGGTTQNAIAANLDGDVGIGTTNPGASAGEKLDIKSADPAAFVPNTMTTWAALGLGGSSATVGDAVGIRFITSTAASHAAPGIAGIVGPLGGGGGGDGGLVFMTATGNTVYERMRIIDAGYIGIATTTPVAKLHIASGANYEIIGNATPVGFLTINNSQDYDPQGNTWMAFGDNANVFNPIHEYSTPGDMFATFHKSSTGGGLRIQQVSAGASTEVGWRNYLTDTALNTTKSSAGRAMNRHDFYLNSSGSRGAVTADGNMVSWTNNNTAVAILDAEGTLHLAAGTAVLSDKRVKQDIRDYDSGLNKILQLEPKKFIKYNGFVGDDGNVILEGNGEKRIGLLAQDVYQVIPEVVNKPTDDKSLWSLNTEDFTPVLINGIQDLDAKINKLVNQTVKAEQPPQLSDFTDDVEIGAATAIVSVTVDVQDVPAMEDYTELVDYDSYELDGTITKKQRLEKKRRTRMKDKIIQKRKDHFTYEIPDPTYQYIVDVSPPIYTYVIDATGAQIESVEWIASATLVFTTPGTVKEIESKEEIADATLVNTLPTIKIEIADSKIADATLVSATWELIDVIEQEPIMVKDVHKASKEVVTGTKTIVLKSAQEKLDEALAAWNPKPTLLDRIKILENENAVMKKQLSNLVARIEALEAQR